MARRRGVGIPWVPLLFFGAWTALALWWLSVPTDRTLITAAKVFVLLPGLLGLMFTVIIGYVVVKIRGAMRGLHESLAEGMGPEIDEAANKLLDAQVALWGRPHEYRIVDPAEFEGADTGYYDDARRWLEGQGFVFLADVENVTLSGVMPNLRTFLRVMTGDGGAVMAAAYQVRMEAAGAALLPPGDEDDADDADERDADRAGGAVRRINALEFESELEDGTFLVTNALADSDRTGDVPGVDKLRLKAGTAPEDVLATHRRRLADARTAGRAVRSLETYDDVMASQHRMHALKCARQRDIGFLDEETMAKTGGGMNVFGEKLVARVRELYAQRLAAGSIPPGTPGP